MEFASCVLHTGLSTSLESSSTELNFMQIKISSLESIQFLCTLESHCRSLVLLRRRSCFGNSQSEAVS